MKVVRASFLLLAIVLTVPLLACMTCGDSCCCPNCHPLCPQTEFKCLDLVVGGNYRTCTNVGEACPWSGCAGWACLDLKSTPDATEIVSVTIGEARPQYRLAATPPVRRIETKAPSRWRRVLHER
ncbi:MAG: hypothetical protein QOJ98_1559 [Acidobacteriota bacterium]|nr:hypothetical protein [Acidobacteriota bacterium]